MTLDDYLNQPCDETGCDRIASNTNGGRIVCSEHTNHNLYARAMND